MYGTFYVTSFFNDKIRAFDLPYDKLVDLGGVYFPRGFAHSAHETRYLVKGFGNIVIRCDAINNICSLVI